MCRAEAPAASSAAVGAMTASGVATITTSASRPASATSTAGAASRAATARVDEASGVLPATATGRQPRAASARATAVPARPGPTSANARDGLVASTLRSLSFRSRRRVPDYWVCGSANCTSLGRTPASPGGTHGASIGSRSASGTITNARS